VPPTRIQTARAAAKKLSDRSNELNAELAKAEEAIAALRVGVRATVVLEVDEEEGTETHLCFERHEGKWSLTIRDGRPELEDWSTTPLLKASRRRRMEAAQLLPALVDELVLRIESEIGQVEPSIGATQGFIERLRSAKA
jgi:hypothetical protein